VACYSFTRGTISFIAGRVGDDLGHKRMFIISAWLSTRSGHSSMVSSVQQHVLFVFARILQGMDGSIHDISKYHMNAQPIILTGPEEEYRVCDLWSCCIFRFHLSFATGGLFAFGSWP
jgi:MFS family permease